MENNNNQTQEFNLLPFVVEAFGYNKKIYKNIDRLYKKHRYKFYRAAKNNELYNNQIITECSLLQEEYCRKALGILMCLNTDKTVNEDLIKIVHKGWAYTCLYAENHSEINLGDFLEKFIRKNKGLDNLTDDDINANITILIFYSINLEKPIKQDETYKVFYKSSMARMSQYSGKDVIFNNKRYATVRSSDMSPEEQTKLNELKKKIFAQYGQINSYNSLLDNKFKKYYIGRINFLFDYERVTSSILNELNFTNKDVDEILSAYTAHMENDNGIIPNIEKAEKNINDTVNFLICSIYIKLLIKAYKQVKEHYFENNKETMFIELEGTEQELNIAKQELQSKNEKISNLQEQFEQKDKELSRLKNEVSELNQNQAELNSLREFMFNMDHKQEYSPEKIDVSRLKKVKGLILGGHPKWQDKMKGLLPDFTFIAPEALNFDVNILKNIDIIFIYTDYLNHAIYYRLMPEAQKLNIKIQYLAANTNTDIVLQEIYIALNI